MQANEIRIGNYILHHNHKIKESFDECIVWMISEDHLRVRVNDSHNEAVSSDYCSGIPLTEEWLLGFGLDKETCIGSDFYMIFESPDYEENKIFVFSRNNEHLAVVKHVHQLQNLYFALTGEELILRT